MRRFMLALPVFGLVALTTAKKCSNITVPISISARNGVFNLSAPANNIEATNFVLNLAQAGQNYSATLLSGYQTVSGDYNISTTLCHPDSGPSSILQVLTHGIAFDRGYWDFSYNGYNYSYVNQAVDKYGYSTFSWDRLGVGESSHGEPINEIQVWLEVAALSSLTGLLRNGSLPGAGQKYEKLIHVGHSFGSIQSYTLAVINPSISDGLILTGFSQNGSFISDFLYAGGLIEANTLSSLQEFPTGYLASSDVSSAQRNFFSPGDFDPDILSVAYSTGQPVTPGELLTIGGLSGVPSEFAGPVLVITGERDIPFCGGNCLATGDPGLASIPMSSKQFLNASSNFEAYIVPGAGHGLNLEYSHVTTYSQIFDFLGKNGLAAD
ncbi:alpha/beta-hydrolase [Microthyrium microscopicum]|uniref:Alpha/beta-hydrolase n=1 Tax=Microthyrium microscopicum TaxID=703497 RepID=A0A6A6UNE0_9PEZI|nr:alpha/beta-hydrolase [Microthyrium microscopicum]